MSLDWVKPGNVGAREVAETEIQRAFETHLEDIDEGLQLVSSFVRTPVGTIDSLAVDSERRPVILEFKKPEGSDRDALIQSLDYYSWCIENVSWLNEYVRKAKPNLLPQGETLAEQIRVILIAEEFEERIKRAVQGIDPEVLLVEYDLRATPSGKIQISPTVVVDTSISTSRKPLLPKSIDEHFDGKDAARQIYDRLIEEIRKFDPNVQPVATQAYINIWVGVTGVVVRKKHLIIHSRGKLDHRDFREWTSWGSWGKPGEGGSIAIGNVNDLNPPVISWIRNAHEQSRRG
jgi:hypothetical protein